MMKVEVHLYSQSQPCEYETVLNTYTKDGLFCVLKANGDVHKHPVEHIFRVKEQNAAEAKVLLYAPAGEPRDFWEAAAKWLMSTPPHSRFRDPKPDIKEIHEHLDKLWAEWY